MRMGLLGTLRRARYRQAWTATLTLPTARRSRLFLESLETRALPSVLTTSPRLLDPTAPALGGLADGASVTALHSHQGDQGPGQDGGPGQNDGPGDGQGDNPGGNRLPPVQLGGDSQLGLEPTQPDIAVVPSGDGFGDKQPAQDGNGQAGGQDGNPDGSDGSHGGGSGGQTGGSDSGSEGSNRPPGDSTGNQDPSQDSGSNVPGDPSPGNQGSSQTSLPGDNGNQPPSTQPAPAANAPTDTGCGMQGGQNDPTTNSPTAGASANPKAPADPGPDARASSGSTLPSVGVPDGVNPSANGQGSAPDMKLHGQNNGSVPESEQRSPASTAEGKQHGSDGILLPGEELHPVAAGSAEQQQNNRNLAGPASLPQNAPVEEAGPRQTEEHVFYVEAPQRLAMEVDIPDAATEELFASAGSSSSEPIARERNYPSVSPKDHGLLASSLALDLASLRSEVQSFFDQIHNLGRHATEKPIGMLLSSGAVVVAAAMACDVARRQVRRRPGGSAFVGVPRLKLASEADAPSGIGLPHFGQFSGEW